MRLADGARALAMIAVMIGGQAQADDPKYGKVETFQPGKKYTCVPTADHKGWDCKEIALGGAAGSKQGSGAPPAETTPLAPAAGTHAPEPIPAAPVSAPPAPAAAPTQPKPVGLPAYLRADGPAVPAQAAHAAAPSAPAAAGAAPPAARAAAQPAMPATVVEAPAPPKAPAATASPSKFADAAPATTSAASPTANASSERAPEAQAMTPPSAAPALPPAAAEPVPTPTSTPAPAPKAAAAEERVTRTPAAVTQESATSPQPAPAAPSSAPRPAREPIAARPPREAEQPAPPAAPTTAVETAPASARAATALAPAPLKSAPGAARGNREFLALPESDYVVELAHSANVADFAALRASLQLTRGQLYQLRLRRDNGDWWLLVWASFDSVDAARAARADLPADAAINAGWPRRIGVLQSEARRASPGSGLTHEQRSFPSRPTTRACRLHAGLDHAPGRALPA